MADTGLDFFRSIRSIDNFHAADEQLASSGGAAAGCAAGTAAGELTDKSTIRMADPYCPEAGAYCRIAVRVRPAADRG